MIVSVTADVLAAQIPGGSTPTPTYGRLPMIIVSPTPTPAPMHVVNPAVIATVQNGTYTDSPLLYSVGNNSIYVIEVNTNKVIDIIHFDKNIQVFDAAVNADYTKLYVLYYDSPKSPSQINDYDYDSYRYYYIATVDLKTDQVVDTTKEHGLQPVYIVAQPVRMLLSKDGKYLYLVFHNPGISTIYQYDVNANTFTGYLDVNQMFPITDAWSNVKDMALAPDGGHLYVTDADHEAVFRLSIPDMSTYSKVSPEYYTDDEPVLQGIDVSLDSQTIYVANYDHVNKSFFIIRQGQMTPQNGPGFVDVDTTGKPMKIKAGPDGKKIHVLEPDSHAVETWVFDVNAIWKDASYGTGSWPIDMALSPDGSGLYVLNSGDDTVTALDMKNKAAYAQSPIKVGPEMRRLTMGPQPAGPVWVNKSHNIATLKNPNTIVPVSRSSLPLTGNASGTGFRVMGNGTFVPITAVNGATGFRLAFNGALVPIPLINETPVPSPTPKESRVPVIVPGGSTTPTAAANATETPSSAPSTAPVNTPRAVGTPGFEGLVGVLCVVGVAALLNKKAG